MDMEHTKTLVDKGEMIKAGRTAIQELEEKMGVVDNFEQKCKQEGKKWTRMYADLGGALAMLDAPFVLIGGHNEIFEDRIIGDLVCKGICEQMDEMRFMYEPTQRQGRRIDFGLHKGIEVLSQCLGGLPP